MRCATTPKRNVPTDEWLGPERSSPPRPRSRAAFYRRRRRVPETKKAPSTPKGVGTEFAWRKRP